MSSNDDYNPWQTMSLATVPERKQEVRKQLNVTNNVADISGARPARRIREIHKPDLHNTSDIRGSRPSQLIPRAVNKPDLTTTADIEGAQAVRQRKSTRVVDPLNPSYPLPSYKAKPATPAKYYGDRLMDISDIAGTKPKGPKKPSGRDKNDTSDIDGSTSDYKPARLKQRRDPPRDFNDVSDIMSTGFATRRTTNGLRPKYVVNGMVIQDDDPGMGPRKLIRERRDHRDFHNPSDIEGANSAYKSQKFANRRQVRNPVAIDDIPGAGADTVVKALRTKRVTNPNNPSYTSLCGSKLGTVTKPSTPDPRNSTFFASLDADGDGHVTYAELLEAADANHDGNLTVAELHKFAKGKISDRELARIVREADGNNDGVISAVEGGEVGTSMLLRGSTAQSGRSSRVPTGRSANQEHRQRGRTRGGGGGGGGDADEIDRLRAELEQLRSEATVLRATAPVSQPQRSRSTTSSSATGGARRTATAAAAARAAATRSRGAASLGGSGSQRSAPATSGSVASRGGRGGESARARRERIATAREIEAVRALP